MTPEQEVNFLRRKLIVVEEENDELREELRQRKDAAISKGLVIPVEWELSPIENMFLAYMLTHSNPLSYSNYAYVIPSYTTSPEGPPQKKILNVYVHKIRKKLGKLGFPDCVTTVYGVGYRIPKPVRDKLLAKIKISSDLSK